MKLRCVFALAALAPGLACSQGEALSQAHSEFAQPIGNGSTSPTFVKITVIEAATKREFTTCVTANLFLGALHIEHELPYNRAGTEAVAALATSSGERVFSFRTSAALENMPWHPSTTELAEAVEALSRIEERALNDSLRDGILRDHYTDHPRRHERMAALACALIDRGYTPRMSDIGGALYVE